jgi:hypothetical protein
VRTDCNRVAAMFGALHLRPEQRAQGSNFRDANVLKVSANGLALCGGDVPCFASDPQDERWREIGWRARGSTFEMSVVPLVHWHLFQWFLPETQRFMICLIS